MASPKFTAMMAARRGFEGVPVPEAVWPLADANGVYSDDLLQAYWVAGNRPVMRHELMHGIRANAERDPSLSAAIPWWARGAHVGGFRDELLARLAARDMSQITQWDTAAYPRLTAGDRAMYAAFDAGRAAASPAAVAGALTGAGLLAYGLSAPDEPAVADEPNSLDRIIERLGRP